MYIKYHLYIIYKENYIINIIYHLLNNNINYMMNIMLHFGMLHIMNYNYGIYYLSNQDINY